jgi:gamma-glutamyltranspeptidase
MGSQPPGEAVAAGRWAVAGEQVVLEGHTPEPWFDGLIARGHRVLRRPAFNETFGQAQLIVSRGDHLAAASDPRSATWAAASL